jgi:hypothetical protein
MPLAEQLTERRVAGWRRHRLSYVLLIQLVIIFCAGLTLFFMLPRAISLIP